MSDDHDGRALMLAHLDAAKHYLETAGPVECAIELVTQGLDVVPPERWDEVIEAAKRSIDES